MPILLFFLRLAPSLLPFDRNISQQTLHLHCPLYWSEANLHHQHLRPLTFVSTVSIPVFGEDRVSRAIYLPSCRSGIRVNHLNTCLCHVNGFFVVLLNVVRLYSVRKLQKQEKRSEQETTDSQSKESVSRYQHLWCGKDALTACTCCSHRPVAHVISSCTFSTPSGDGESSGPHISHSSKISSARLRACLQSDSAV